MADQYDVNPTGLLVPRTSETVRDTKIKTKGKDFIEKAVADPEAMHHALILAATKLAEPKVELDADLVDKTKKLLEELPEPEPLQGTIGAEKFIEVDEMFAPPPPPKVEFKTRYGITAEPGQKVKSDGSSTSYYELPVDARELNDLIEHKHMGFAHGNIFKACYRLGEKDGADLMYDINKIIFFAERMKAYVKKHGRLP
jgi:hypothetical protein